MWGKGGLVSDMSSAVTRCTLVHSLLTCGTSPDLVFDFIVDWGIANVGEGRASE